MNITYVKIQCTSNSMILLTLIVNLIKLKSMESSDIQVASIQFSGQQFNLVHPKNYIYDAKRQKIHPHKFKPSLQCLRITEMIDKFKAKVSLFSENWFHLNVSHIILQIRAQTIMLTLAMEQNEKKNTRKGDDKEIDKIQIRRDGYVSLLSSCICPVIMFPEGAESKPGQQKE